MTATRTFHIGDLLTVTTGIFLAPSGVGAIYELIDFVTGQPGHMTHQLPRASEEIAPELLRQHPFLADIVVPDGLHSEEAVLGWLTEVGAEHGAWFEVNALPEGAYVGREPIAELVEKVGADRVIAVGEPPDDLSGGPR